MRNMIAGLAAATALAVPAAALGVPAAANASFSSEMKAGNRAEQRLQHRYPGYSVYGLCDQQGRRYWCSVGGSRGHCFVSGHAWVSRTYYGGWRTRLVGVTRSCF